MPDETNKASRRSFLAHTGGAVAGTLVAPAVLRASGGAGKTRVALVGTGIRGTTMWGKQVLEEQGDVVDIVGLCDINPGRLEFAKGYMGASCETFTDFERMVKETSPEKVVVTTVDATHDQFIVRALELGSDVITEKPLTTDEVKCQRILETQQRTGRDVVVTFNYRYSPHRQRIKQHLLEGRIGKVTSVDFHWYLDVYHGADYFRRWHGKERFSGTLFVHKASHHFDLLNWWIGSEPEEVFGYGGLEYYGKNHAYRSGKCRGCPRAAECRHFWDITQDELLTNLYVKNEHHDGYIRDGCVWSDEIDIFDKMAAQIRYANGVQVSYSCTTYSPYEGYRIAFNGTEGRLEAWIQERQPWPGVSYDEIRITDNFEATHLERIPHDEGGHGGGDTRLRDRIFRNPNAPDPYQQAVDVRAGAMAILIGIGARKSARSGQPVKIGNLTSLQPRA